MFLGMLIAIAVPLIFLALVRWLDLYASGSFKVVLICLAGGILAFSLALPINTFISGYVNDIFLVLTLTAPIAEEILKSLVLVYAVRRPDFTYFVDGAIYGFAAGTAFAVLENLFYLGGADTGTGLTLAVTRAFSTSLMHGSASALVGVSLGRLRYGRGVSRFVSLLLGWAAAMTLHITFNNVVNRDLGSFTLLAAIALGLGGVGLIAGFIFWGLSEERRWLHETLGLKLGVSTGEAAVVQKLDSLDLLLEPITERFGAERRKQVEEFLKLQAQLGLKRKVQQMTTNPQRQAELDRQIQALRSEIDAVRRDLGIYCMSYVRSILPPETEPIWDRLAQLTEAPQPSNAPNMWSKLGVRMDERESEQDS